MPTLKAGTTLAYAEDVKPVSANAPFGLQRFTLSSANAPLRAAAPALWKMEQAKLPQEPLRLAAEVENTTSSAGGSYAVTDTMRAERRPTHRRNALSTALVFKIDGETDTPSVGVGGGGVAAAVWKAIPR